MKGDFSRDTFDPARHYSRVLMQQGRVQLDADDNEQVAILLHYLRALATDLIGPFGGPTRLFDFEPSLPEKTSFRIEPFIHPKDNRKDLKIGFGRYYVDGILCENISPLLPGQTPADAFISYYSQVDYPLDPDHVPLDVLPGAPFLVYLDVWERHITSLEDDRLREVALGGPDTATRAQIVWQVKTAKGGLPPLDDGNEFGDAWLKMVQTWQPDNRGRLRAWTKDLGGKPDEACITPPDARYRGTENQLYRVEIHTGGSAGSAGTAGTATFKWSRDNGSIVAAWLGDEDDRLIVSGIRDEARGFAAEQWVELSHDNLALRGMPGPMASLDKVEEDTLTLTWKPGVTPIHWDKNLRNPTVRRWDSGEIGIEENKDIELENGVMIRFAPATQYRSGDYWLIPARVATGDVEWPQETGSDGTQSPKSIAPHGITHHYAPLWVFLADGPGTDYRRLFSVV